MRIPTSNDVATDLPRGWHRLFFGARTRILAWYVGLAAVSGAFSMLTLRPNLYNRLEERIEESLVQEVDEFHQVNELPRRKQRGIRIKRGLTAHLDVVAGTHSLVA